MKNYPLQFKSTDFTIRFKTILFIRFKILECDWSRIDNRTRKWKFIFRLFSFQFLNKQNRRYYIWRGSKDEKDSVRYYNIGISEAYIYQNKVFNYFRCLRIFLFYGFLCTDYKRCMKSEARIEINAASKESSFFAVIRSNKIIVRKRLLMYTLLLWYRLGNLSIP